MTREERIKAFEQVLDNAWKGYVDRGAAIVDALEENTQELAFAKGFKAGYEQALEHPIVGDLLYVLNKGHEQGWKDAVNKACKIIDTYLDMVRKDIAYTNKEFIKDFKKEMKEQQ